MLHTQPTKQAAEYLRQVIPLLSQEKLPPTPINYSVFYCYLSGFSSALTQVIDGIRQDKKTFTLPLMLELYEKYVLGSETLELQEKIQQTLEQVMRDASEEVSQANDEASDYTTLITQHSDTLSTDSDPHAMSLVLSQILQDTRSMVKSNTQIQERMQDTNNEIAKLKTELALVKEAADQDALTGLKNRGAFDQKIKQLLSMKGANDCALIIIDIDHFKRINDSFGHLVGDRVIRYISSLLTQLIGDKHFISRYGGEEFTVILEGVPRQDVELLANKVRIAMANSKLQRKGSQDTLGQVTLSAGITSLSIDDNTESFIARADKALYQAKETGRNKVVFLT